MCLFLKHTCAWNYIELPRKDQQLPSASAQQMFCCALTAAVSIRVINVLRAYGHFRDFQSIVFKMHTIKK